MNKENINNMTVLAIPCNNALIISEKAAKEIFDQPVNESVIERIRLNAEKCKKNNLRQDK